MAITKLIPFKYLLYSTLLSNVVSYEEDGTRYGIFAESQADLYDYFPDWDSSDDRKNDIFNALNELSEEGLLYFDDEGRITLGEYRGKRFFPFEVKNSLFDSAKDFLEDSLRKYSRGKSAVSKSRSKFIRSRIEDLLEKGVDKFSPNDFTELHSYLYEIYTGGEVYIIRNKVEHFQTNNMMKAYDRFTVFALIVEATLNFDKYRRKGLPTLVNVSCMKDDVMRSLTRSGIGSKEYMRDMDSISSGGF